ncbi:glucan 1,3-beta-glucosidase [Malassezia yamatoensis]|uniref:Glucan 1,3-beta-glucosidase n=1 Tax=Malassezia yamatoensis TaxID=253288 RepID=A0AAJ5YZ38_9BASI|nr:glucan 1,3-beta-glucosidase [Malassezia yamatoensis]
MVKITFFSLLACAMATYVTAGGTNVSLAALNEVPVDQASSTPVMKRMERMIVSRADAVNLRFPYGQEKVRGVSVGGWLVIENFISPEIYQSSGDNRVIDEWSFGKYVDHDKAVGILQPHFDNFITEQDFEEIASMGLNHVRVPFPYWGVKKYSNDPYIKLNQYDKLKEAAGWAKNHNLNMIIELHTVPGGANPYDHGGHTNHSNFLNSADNQGRALEVLDILTTEFTKSKYSAVSGISLVNEPNGDVDTIRRFYQRGYNTVRGAEGSKNMLVIIGDAFNNPASSDYWSNKMQPPKYQGVGLDTHIYRLFDTTSIAMSQDQRISYYCSLKKGFKNANQHLWSMVGEWSPVFTDCAPGLNGRFQGSRYEGKFPGSKRRGSCSGHTGNANQFSPAFIANLRKNWAAQADAFEAGLGWIMWTWKVSKHTADEWSYKAGVQHGWIPKDPTNRESPC